MSARKRLSMPQDTDLVPMEVDAPETVINVVNNAPSSIPNAGPSTNVNGNTHNDELDNFSDDEEGGVRIGDIYIPPAPKPTLSMEATGPRLIITDIVNENFKSYAGKQVLGPFHKSFTAIIGPNGSGKSNVIDSMLFVFGYRAAKIRSKKISVLLHSSKNHPNITSASVAVHFVQIIDKDDADGYTEVPNTKLVIARTAFKDNSSHYTLNGRKVQFKEVSKVLKSHGIDLDHNRFLILQGEVEQIAMMKSKGQTEHETGMLEYLEDIVGTSRFKEPIEKLSIRVEELTEARKEKLNRVRLVEGEKQKLEGPMKEALAQLNIANNLTRAKNTLLQKYMYTTSKKIADIKVDREKHQISLNELDENMTQLKATKNEKNTVLVQGNKKYEKLEQRKEELTELFKTMKGRDVALQADVTQTTKRKKNIQGVLEQEKSKLMDLEQVPEKSKRDIKDCEELDKKLAQQKETQEADLQKFMASIRTETIGLQDAKDKVQLKLIDLKKIEDEKKQIFKLAESEMKIYISTEEKEKEKLTNLKEALENVTFGIQEKKEKLTQLTTSIPAKEKALVSAKRELETLQAEEHQKTARVRTLRGQVEESRQAMTANKSKGRVLDSLIAEKQAGRLPGIYGRLGDLGAIDAKYDVAISTCCGPLDNIVVDNVGTAQYCIEYLRDNNVGRATFIVLEKQEHLQSQCYKKMNTPENAPRLLDLIKVSDEKIRPAFCYALRDTLVANDLEQASRIAYGATRFRVVTLAGDVIEIAGTMSGGGRSTLRGRMGRTVEVTNEIDPRIIQAQEEELETLSERTRELRSMLPELESKVNSLTREIAQMKMNKNKMEMEYKNLVEQAPGLKIQVKEQTDKAASSAVDAKKKAALEKTTREAETLYEKAKYDSDKIEKEVQEIHEKIVAVSGGKVKTLQKGITEITGKIDKVHSEITRLNVAIKTSERNAKKSKEKIAQMQKEINDLEEKLKKMNEEKKQITLDGSWMEKELDDIAEKLSEGVEEFAELKEEIASLVKQENKCKSDRLEIVNTISKVDKSIDDLKAKIPSWKRELSSLVLEIIPLANEEPIPPLSKYSDEELEVFKTDDLQSKVQIQEERLGEHKPNLQAIQEYKAKEEIFLKRANELEEITNQRNSMREQHDKCRRIRHTEFLAGFNTITAKLKEMYQMITLGGDAELELVDSLDPFTEGIVFSVRPPNKSWKNISNLSGGEKTLSSLALVFALHYYKPTPLYVMDEIDAALDFKNVSIVANYIKERTKNAQFIIISLRHNMFELANKLVGIYKTNDCTKSVTLLNTTEVSPTEEKVV